MASVINTNVMSLNAQRQLNKSQSTQNEAMERLSSGLRINSAKDDVCWPCNLYWYAVSNLWY
ncbi:hypothetical protein ACLKMH_06635 [Psychromonas sp. KJ10-10]|uniref:flagellin N-terminal helical domain-containing protein n=1 Tax=Psychromonas sp. KJ10-10 TaxID=3391823 RepID=UPI0039B6A694